MIDFSNPPDTDQMKRFVEVENIIQTAKNDHHSVSQSMLKVLEERTQDESFKVRKEAMRGLALILMKRNDIRDASENEWIQNKILHNYYMPDIEDRLLVNVLSNATRQLSKCTKLCTRSASIAH